MHSKHSYQRISRRLPNYNYSNEGFYFITLNIQDEIPLFGDIYDGELQLNTFGNIAKEEWLKTKQIRDNIVLHEFIVMPNHFHAIVEIMFSKIEIESDELNQYKSPTQSIRAIVRGFTRSNN